MTKESEAIVNTNATPSDDCNEEIAPELSLLDLNDDCLREICDYLDLTDLCTVADVCERFKQAAQAKFRSLKVKDVKKDVWVDLPDIAKYRLLRNFGPSITSLVAVALKKNNEYLVLMIIRYCGEALKALTLHSFRINAYLGERLLSLIARLEKFGIIECHCQPSFCERLPANSMNLRELEFKFEYYSQYSNVFVLGGLPQTFPKLETFSIVDLENRDLKAFLIKNRQLKTINLESANGNEDHFSLIAEHLPNIENLGMVVAKRWNMDNHSNIRKMSALKSLLLKSHRSADVNGILKKMATANVPIETLELIKCPSNELLKLIPGFQKLKVLRLVDVENLKLPDVLKMCKTLDDLTELQYRTDTTCSIPDLLTLIRSVRKLQKLNFQKKNGKLSVDADMFMKIVNIVKTRGNEADSLPLEIVFMGKMYSIDVTKEMMKAHKHLLTIEIKAWEDIDFGFPVHDDFEFEFNFELDFLHSFASRTRRRRL